METIKLSQERSQCNPNKPGISFSSQNRKCNENNGKVVKIFQKSRFSKNVNHYKIQDTNANSPIPKWSSDKTPSYIYL